VLQEVQRRFCVDSKSEKSDPKLPSGRPSHASGRSSVSRSFEQFKVASVRTSRQCIWTLISVRQVNEFPSQTQIWEDSSIVWTTGLHLPDAILDKARHEEELQSSGRQGNTVRMQPYYGIYVQQKCNRPDAKATPSGRCPNMVLCEAHYGKLVAQLSVQMASA
jgi:hypothetical protein